MPQMKNTKKTNKKVPVAIISLLPEGYGEEHAAPKGCKISRKRKGHWVRVVTRYRTYLRTGSGTKITHEHFESHREWRPDAKRKGGR